MFVKGKEFRGQRVRLDGKVFEGCTFDRCTMVYSGTQETVIAGGSVESCQWHFEGPALNVFRFLVMVERSGGRDLVQELFQEVRNAASEIGPRPN